MIYIFIIVQICTLVCMVASASSKGKSVNLNLETVMVFDQKNLDQDVNVIDKVQEFLSKVRRVLDKSRSYKRSLDDAETGGEITFTEFLQHVINNLLSYNDEELEKIADIIDEEIRKYHYKGCKFYELVENNDNLRHFVTDVLDHMKKMKGEKMRKILKRYLKKLQNNDFEEKEMALIKYINSLYTNETQGKMKSVLKVFRDISQISRRSHTDLVKVIRNGLRTIIFDHYSKFNENTRGDIKMNIESYFIEYLTEGKKGKGETITYSTVTEMDYETTRRSVHKKMKEIGRTGSNVEENTTDANWFSPIRDLDEEKNRMPFRFISLYTEHLPTTTKTTTTKPVTKKRLRSHKHGGKKVESFLKHKRQHKMKPKEVESSVEVESKPNIKSKKVKSYVKREREPKVKSKEVENSEEHVSKSNIKSKSIESSLEHEEKNTSESIKTPVEHASDSKIKSMNVKSSVDHESMSKVKSKNVKSSLRQGKEPKLKSKIVDIPLKRDRKPKKLEKSSEQKRQPKLNAKKIESSAEVESKPNIKSKKVKSYVKREKEPKVKSKEVENSEEHVSKSNIQSKSIESSLEHEEKKTSEFIKTSVEHASDSKIKSMNVESSVEHESMSKVKSKNVKSSLRQGKEPKLKSKIVDIPLKRDRKPKKLEKSSEQKRQPKMNAKKIESSAEEESKPETESKKYESSMEHESKPKIQSKKDEISSEQETKPEMKPIKVEISIKPDKKPKTEPNTAKKKRGQKMKSKKVESSEEQESKPKSESKKNEGSEEQEKDLKTESNRPLVDIVHPDTVMVVREGRALRELLTEHNTIIQAMNSQSPQSDSMQGSKSMQKKKRLDGDNQKLKRQRHSKARSTTQNMKLMFRNAYGVVESTDISKEKSNEDRLSDPQTKSKSNNKVERVSSDTQKSREKNISNLTDNTYGDKLIKLKRSKQYKKDLHRAKNEKSLLPRKFKKTPHLRHDIRNSEERSKVKKKSSELKRDIAEDVSISTQDKIKIRSQNSEEQKETSTVVYVSDNYTFNKIQYPEKQVKVVVGKLDDRSDTKNRSKVRNSVEMTRTYPQSSNWKNTRKPTENYALSTEENAENVKMQSIDNKTDSFNADNDVSTVTESKTQTDLKKRDGFTIHNRDPLEKAMAALESYENIGIKSNISGRKQGPLPVDTAGEMSTNKSRMKDKKPQILSFNVAQITSVEHERTSKSDNNSTTIKNNNSTKQSISKEHSDKEVMSTKKNLYFSSENAIDDDDKKSIKKSKSKLGIFKAESDVISKEHSDNDGKSMKVSEDNPNDNPKTMKNRTTEKEEHSKNINITKEDSDKKEKIKFRASGDDPDRDGKNEVKIDKSSTNNKNPKDYSVKVAKPTRVLKYFIASEDDFNEDEKSTKNINSKTDKSSTKIENNELASTLESFATNMNDSNKPHLNSTMNSNSINATEDKTEKTTTINLNTTNMSSRNESTTISTSNSTSSIADTSVH